MKSDSPSSASGAVLDLIARGHGVRDLDVRMLVIHASVEILEEIAQVDMFDMSGPTLDSQRRNQIEMKFRGHKLDEFPLVLQIRLRPGVDSQINHELPVW